MKYRALGNTGLQVSEIGLGGEWLERHNTKEVVEVMAGCRDNGINIVDCWMSEPNVRSNIGKGMAGCRDKWIIQGQIGSTWQNGQYAKTRDVAPVKVAFEDLLTRMNTDYMDIGMIHFVDLEEDFEKAFNGPFYDYVLKLKQEGKIRCIGMSTHNPIIAKRAVEMGAIDMMLFSINPAYDMQPPTDNLDIYFQESYDAKLGGIAPERAELYSLCEAKGVGITVMKGFAGGRLLKAEASWFGTALTPIQCIHYALTRPAVSSILVGMENPQQLQEALHYEEATDEEKDYASVLAKAPHHAFGAKCTYCGHCQPCPVNIDIAMVNKYYDLAAMQPTVPASVREHYKGMIANADDCIGCAACESRCPFGVKITEKMELAKELFK